MRRLATLLVLLLVMGCGKQDSAEPETTSTPTAAEQGASSAVEPQQPLEPTLADKVLGSYTHVTADFTMNYEFLDNGAIEFSGEGGGGIFPCNCRQSSFCPYK